MGIIGRASRFLVADGLKRVTRRRAPGPQTTRRKVIGPATQLARVATNAGRRAGKSILFRERSAQVQEELLHEGQMQAEMKANRDARTKRRDVLMGSHASTRIKAIQEVLKKIIEDYKKRNGVRQILTIEHDAMIERLAINLFENLEGKTDFIAAKTPASKQALESILMNVEGTLGGKINPGKISMPVAEQIEGTINQTIQQVFEQLQKQGQM